jgi:hypothetical protein
MLIQRKRDLGVRFHWKKASEVGGTFLLGCTDFGFVGVA